LDVLSLVVGAVAGFAGKALEEAVRQKLAGRTARDTERRAHAHRALENCYWPARTLVDEMISSYPDVDGPCDGLRALIRTSGYLLDDADAELLWVATSKHAELRDLVRAQELFIEAVDRKSTEAGRQPA
jgi:hypothetical protein